MAKRKKKNPKKPISIKDILKGKFLVEKGSFKHWRFVFFLALLAFLIISSSHWADKKVVAIDKLQKEVAELNANYASIHKDLMKSHMESTLSRLAEKDSLVKSEVQPYKIVDYR